MKWILFEYPDGTVGVSKPAYDDEGIGVPAGFSESEVLERALARVPSKRKVTVVNESYVKKFNKKARRRWRLDDNGKLYILPLQ